MSGPRTRTEHAGGSVCTAPGPCVSGQWEASGRANGSPGAWLPCAGARKQPRAKPGAETGEVACCTAAAAAAGGTGSTAVCAASAAGSRAAVHSAGGGGRAHMGCGRRASVSAVAERSGTGMDAPSASGPGGKAHRAGYGLASWATGGSVASMSGAGQHDRASNLRGNGGARGGVELREAPRRWATRRSVRARRAGGDDAVE